MTSFQQRDTGPTSGFYTHVWTRRKFFQRIHELAGLSGLSFAIPLAGYGKSPAFKHRAQS
jgi:hypothetical protein